MSSQRVPQIDVLRGIAVLLVVGSHTIPCPQATSQVLSLVTRVWHRGGWAGVDLFFVISGFLIGSLLLSEWDRYHRINVGRFLLRRTLRLGPTLWLFLSATLVIFRGRYGQNFELSRIFSDFVFVQNYHRGVWPHTWSLAVEMHCYIGLTLGYAAVASREKRPGDLLAVLLLFMSVALVCLGWRLWLASRWPDSATPQFLFPTHLRADAFCAGAFLAYLLHRVPRTIEIARRFRGLFALGGVGLLAPTFILPPEDVFVHTRGFTCNFLGAGCLLLAAVGGIAPPKLVSTVVAYIGQKSYSVYLWHLPFIAYFVPPLLDSLGQRDNWYAYATLCWGGSIVLGVLMAFVSEVPVLWLRNRLVPTRGNVSDVLQNRAAPGTPLQPIDVMASR
jgi:peptidoglycan/LPS O-acetylase OafA/YrhL